LQEEGELRDTVRIRLGSSSSFFAAVDFGKHLTCACTSTLFRRKPQILSLSKPLEFELSERLSLL
jgi:hypothetical protein